MSLKYEEITKDIGVGWVKRSAPIKKMENGNEARIVRRQTYNETGFVAGKRI